MSKQTDLINIPDAITVSGSNVGIGTSSPTNGKLEVTHSSSTIPAGFFRNTSGSGDSSALTVQGGANNAAPNFSVLDYNGNTDFVVQGAGNVGIGESDPDSTLTLKGASHTNFQVKSNSESTKAFIQTVQDSDVRIGSSTNHPVTLYQNGTERMRIDSSGNLLVGKTSADGGATTGFEAKSNGETAISRSGGGNGPLYVNRKTSDGNIITLAKDGTTVGSIGNDGGNMYIGKQSGLGFQGNDIISPNRNGVASDNTIDLGQSSARFDDIYATNGTIQTSDFNEKQDIASLTATEMLVGKRISALFKTFRWKDSVADKGEDARTHTGVIAQDVQAAFTAEGLDAGNYALFISSTWFVDAEGNEVEEGTEGATSKTRMGIRYPELLSFVAAYNEQRFASIEARLTALEA